MRNFNSKFILPLFMLFVLLSCNFNKANKQLPSDSINDQSELAIKALADSLALSTAEYQDLMQDHKHSLQKNQVYNRKIHLLQTEIDSLKTLNIALTDKIIAYNKVDAPKISDEQQEIISMVHRMHYAWKTLPETKDPEQILQFFMPKFSVNQVAINNDDKGQIAQYSHVDYINYVNDIIARDGFSYEFGGVQFLDLEIKKQDFFNVVYKCSMRAYQHDKRLYNNFVMVTITGKRMDGTWKIGNYSLVNFQYQSFNNVTL